MRAPEIWMIGDWCILRVETLGCGIKQMKAEICDARDHFSGRTAPGKGFADTEQTSGARNRRKHGVSIERFDCAQVDNFDIESVTREFLRRRTKSQRKFLRGPIRKSLLRARKKSPHAMATGNALADYPFLQLRREQLSFRRGCARAWLNCN